LVWREGEGVVLMSMKERYDEGKLVVGVDSGLASWLVGLGAH
jgi:hypothetical protein